ncbi:hypothetical protein V5O48_003648 [Marasmius crinis-equi]|uniref:Velvet domain-containing protein n=1 Tax=Marasmius crinis-equi TaxID=585013 RepID=A0ABR3FS96_9AGAR
MSRLLTVLGLVCTVDLFPVPESENAPEKSTQQRSNSYSPTKSRQHTRRTSSTSLSGSSPSHSPQSPYTPQDAYFHRQQPPRIAENTVDSTRYFELSAGGFGEQYNEHHANAVAGSHFESNTHHFQFPQAEYPVFPARSSQQEQHQDTSAGGSHPQPSPALRQQGPEPEDRQNTSPSQAEEEPIHRVNGLPVYEGMQVTHALVGAKFVQPTPVDWRGQKTLMFVFSDLAVKIEGQFILRYRAFDIYSRAAGHNSDLVVQAECYGEPFRVYSTKEFPGLQASTELTKLIARYGVRLNIRETERKRRKLSGGGRAIGGNRNRSSDGDEDEYEEDYGDGNA